MNKEMLTELLNTKSEELLLDYLTKENEFDIFSKNLIVGGHYAVKITLESLSRILIQQSSAISIEKTIADLKQFINAKNIPGRSVLSIMGVVIPHEITLTNKIKMIPYPDTINITDLEKRIIPRIKLVHKTEKLPKLLGEGENLSTFNFSKFNELEDIYTLLTLIKCSKSIAIARWWEPIIWTPIHKTFSTSPYEINKPFIPSETILNSDDLINFKNIHSKYIKITDENTKNKLKTALHRLNRCNIWKDFNPVDAAIDLGVAIDVMFQPKDSKAELKYRFSIYAAWFLGNNPSHRKEIKNLINELYDLRSQAVHVGKLSTKCDISKILNDGAELISNTIIRVIKNGYFPNYDDYVIGKYKSPKK